MTGLTREPILDTLDQFRLLLKLYRNPLAAFSNIIDRGRVLFAIAAALGAVLLLQVPREVELNKQLARAKAYVAAHKSDLEARKAELKRDPQASVPDEEDDEDYTPPSTYRLTAAVDQFTGVAPFHYFSGLMAVAF